MVLFATTCCGTPPTPTTVVNTWQLAPGVFDYLRGRAPNMMPVVPSVDLVGSRSIWCEGPVVTLARNGTAYWKDVQLTYTPRRFTGNVTIDTDLIATGVRYGADTDVNLWCEDTEDCHLFQTPITARALRVV